MKLFTKKWILFALLAAFAPLTLFANDYTVENQPHVLKKTSAFDHVGMLKQKDNGYLYLEVAPEFISEILPMIQCEGRIVPPRHFTSKKGIGAHISVMYENERIAEEIWRVEELGQSFSFEVKELRTVKITRDGKLKKLWLLALEAPTLECLRENYGLPNKIKGHDFHITIGYQMPDAQNLNCQSELFFYMDEALDEEVFAEAA
jgi:hypothetical protein